MILMVNFVQLAERKQSTSVDNVLIVVTVLIDMEMENA